MRTRCMCNDLEQTRNNGTRGKSLAHLDVLVSRTSKAARDERRAGGRVEKLSE